MYEFRSRRDVLGAADDRNPYWISFSDIMAGILVVFILAVVFLILELQERTRTIDWAYIQIKKTNGIREEILGELEGELRKRGINVQISEDKTVLRIPQELLTFASNDQRIPLTSKKTVSTIGEMILVAITKNDRDAYIDTIFIEGHTDSLAAPNFPNGNWGLSTARAISVWRHWSLDESYGQRLLELENRRNERLFSVSGYADSRRLEPDDSASETMKQRNRRIDVRFYMNRPLEEDLQAAIEDSKRDRVKSQ